MAFRVGKCRVRIKDFYEEDSSDLPGLYPTSQDWLAPWHCHTRGLAALAAGLTGIFGWVERQPDLDARMPEFIGLLLLAGILYVIGVFWVESFRLGATALLVIFAGAGFFCGVVLAAP